MPVSRYPDWESFEITPNATDCPVAFCADLSPDSVLSACKRGIFPFPAPDEYTRDINEFQYEDRVSDGVIGLVGSTDDDPYWVAWWSPDPRPVIKVAELHLGRNVRKQLRHGQTRTTANDSFQRVAEECRAGREPRWLTDTLLESMVTLHSEGWAHSIEVWQDSDLIGGAIGIGVGFVLSGDSMFSRRARRGENCGRGYGRTIRSGGRRTDRRTVGQPFPPVTGRRTDATRPLPAPAGWVS